VDSPLDRRPAAGPPLARTSPPSAGRDATSDRPPGAGPLITPRRWRSIYAAAWLLYLIVFSGVFLGYGEPTPIALLAAFANTLPPALLGIAVVAVCRRQRWPPARARRFVLVHLGLAALYALLCPLGSYLLFALQRSLRGETTPYTAWIAVWQGFIALLVFGALVSTVYAARTFERLRREERRAAEARALQARAELRALRAQLNPHFLFNALHTLLALVRREPAAAERAIEQLGELLHYVLASPAPGEASTGEGSAGEGDAGAGGEEVRLAREWEFVRNYLALEELRLAERLRLEVAVDAETLDARVPAFCLQPLVENAIRHAVAPRAGGGRVRIEIGRAGDDLRLAVSDDGPGAEPGAAEAGNGRGLALVRRRLAALYGERAALRIDTAPGRGFTAEVRLPWRDVAAALDGEAGEAAEDAP
jgi:signal transduction histidine kinase